MLVVFCRHALPAHNTLLSLTWRPIVVSVQRHGVLCRAMLWQEPPCQPSNTAAVAVLQPLPSQPQQQQGYSVTSAATADAVPAWQVPAPWAQVWLISFESRLSQGPRLSKKLGGSAVLALVIWSMSVSTSSVFSTSRSNIGMLSAASSCFYGCICQHSCIYIW